MANKFLENLDRMYEEEERQKLCDQLLQQRQYVDDGAYAMTQQGHIQMEEYRDQIIQQEEDNEVVESNAPTVPTDDYEEFMNEALDDQIRRHNNLTVEMEQEKKLNEWVADCNAVLDHIDRRGAYLTPLVEKSVKDAVFREIWLAAFTENSYNGSARTFTAEVAVVKLMLWVKNVTAEFGPFVPEDYEASRPELNSYLKNYFLRVFRNCPWESLHEILCIADQMKAKNFEEACSNSFEYVDPVIVQAYFQRDHFDERTWNTAKSLANLDKRISSMEHSIAKMQKEIRKLKNLKNNIKCKVQEGRRLAEAMQIVYGILLLVHNEKGKRRIQGVGAPGVPIRGEGTFE